MEKASRSRDGGRNAGVFCLAWEVLEEGPRSRHTLQVLLGLPPAQRQRRAATLPCDLGPALGVSALSTRKRPGVQNVAQGRASPKGPAQWARPLSALTRGRGARGRLGLGRSPCGLRAASPRARGQLPSLAEEALPGEPLPTRARVFDALGV